jgi:hypothetical protein
MNSTTKIQYNTTLLFELPDGVTPSEQIEYLANLLTKQPELLLLKITGVSTIGVWGEAE